MARRLRPRAQSRPAARAAGLSRHLLVSRRLQLLPPGNRLSSVKEPTLRTRLRAAALGLLIALTALPAAVRAAPPAQPAGLTMTVRAGYDGHYKLGEWFPVQVTLSNTGQSLDGEVRVGAIGENNDEQIASYIRPVSLPSPSRK